LITKTIGGGFHIYFRFTSKLKTSVKLQDINHIVSIDVRNDNAIIFEGKNYELYNDPTELLEVPEAFINLYTREKHRLKMEENIGNEVLNNASIKLILDNLDESYCDNYKKW
jgi:hypothetical protein